MTFDGTSIPTIELVIEKTVLVPRVRKLTCTVCGGDDKNFLQDWNKKGTRFRLLCNKCAIRLGKRLIVGG